MSYRVLVWLLAAISLGSLIADTLLTAGTGTLLSDDTLLRHGWPLVNLASLVSSLLGALIVLRYRSNPVGWLLLVVGTSTSLSLVTETYANWAFEGVERREVASLDAFVARASAWLGGPLAVVLLTLVFLLVPDGRWLSRRWRNVGIASVVAIVIYAFGIFFTDPLIIVGAADAPELPLGAAVLSAVGFVGITSCLFASIFAMVSRRRRSTDEVRQQLKWILTGAVAVGIGLLCAVIGESTSRGEQQGWTSVPLYLAYFYLLVAIAVAVLRYRLYGIDVIINRAVVLAGATAFVIAAYVVVVIAVGGALDNWTDGFWLSLLVTVAVAVAFQPLRYHLVRLANWLAYGKQAKPYDALADFGRRLGASPDPAVLLPAIAEAAGRATLATMAVVRLGPAERPTRVVIWPDEFEAWSAPAGPFVEVSVADQTGDLGAISVAPPPGLSLRAQELRLLRDIADQAAVAFRNLGLEIELAAHVVLLDEQTDQLAASRRRLISAADAERRRLESAISREVLPTLTDLRATLGQIRDGQVQEVSASRLVDAANQALNSLRELTRGVYPTLLTRVGIAVALTSYFSRAGRPDDLVIDDDVASRRFAERVEIAAYYSCTQAVDPASGPSQVRLSCDEEWLRVDLQLTETAPLDVDALTDRVEACGGTVELDERARVGSRRDFVVCLPAASGQPSTS